jgi:hypothetical protein
MERREFGKIAMAGALGSDMLLCAQGQLGNREAGQASYAGLGRSPMKWGIRHALEINDLRPKTLQLAKQLGMEWVKIGPPSTPPTRTSTTKLCGRPRLQD